MRLPLVAPLVAALVAAALVLAGCSSSQDPVGPTTSSSSPPSSAPSATRTAPPPATSAATSVPQAQASALVGSLASAGALDEQQRQQVQDQLATALADPSNQAELKQLCTGLRTGLLSPARLRSLVRKQLSGSGASLDDAQVDAVTTTLRTDVCTS